MHICLIGDFSAGHDEGFKNAAKELRAQLSAAGHRVVTLDVKASPLRLVMRACALRRPDIVHAISAPTFGSFLLLGLLRVRWPRVGTVLSGLSPSSLGLARRSWLRPPLVRLKPGAIITQSRTLERFLTGLGYRVDVIPNGVDGSRFAPVSLERRCALRAARGIAEDAFVLLHVGHLSHRRNLRALVPLQGIGCQVVVAGSTYLEDDAALGDELEAAGCLIYRGYVERIEELYALADCYVFPLAPGQSLFMPLSVLEAMATNLAVLTTPYEGFVRFFPESHGFRYLRVDAADLPAAVAQLRADRIRDPGTRAMVMPCDWEVVRGRLETVYARVRRNA